MPHAFWWRWFEGGRIYAEDAQHLVDVHACPSLDPWDAVGSLQPNIEHMNDLSPVERLSKLRALEEWLAWQLHNTRQKIRTTEADIERDRRQRKRAHAEAHWKVEASRAGDRRSILHRGGCGQYKNELGLLEREDVVLLLQDDSMTIEMCGICRPETGLQA